MFKVAIAGCANVGKTSLFNLLTGKKNKTGNWEGVTVDISHGKMLFSKDILIFDLPGINKLEEKYQTIDQIKSKKFLIEEEINLIINVINLDNLHQNLQLSIELCQLGKPMLIVIQDDRSKKVKLKLLGLESIYLNLHKKGIIRDLINTIKSICYNKSEKSLEALDLIAWENIDKDEVIKNAIDSLEIDHKNSSRDNIIDKFVMNRFIAIPIFITVICIMLFLIIIVGEYFKGYFEDIAELFLINPITYAMEYISLPQVIISTFQYGVGPGIKTIASFIPLLFILYILLGALDESGYMTRASIIIGKLASKVGLSGKSIIPLIVGFGCNVPAIIGARIIENERQRLFTIILIPFMSCGARLTIFALFASSFFPENSPLVICFLYFFSVFLAGIVAMVLQPYFINEHYDETKSILPRYRMPRFTTIVKHTNYKIKHFIIGTGKTITLMSIILYWLSVIPIDVMKQGIENVKFEEKVSKNSIIVNLSKDLSYIFKPIGITEDNWPATVSLITGIIAKEVVVSTLLTLYDIQEADVINPKLVIKKYFKHETNAFGYILFVLIYFPCITVFSTIKKELSLKIAIYTSIFYTILAYIVAMSFHEISIYCNYSIPISLSLLMLSIGIIGLVSRAISIQLFKK